MNGVSPTAADLHEMLDLNGIVGESTLPTGYTLTPMLAFIIVLLIIMLVGMAMLIRNARQHRKERQYGLKELQQLERDYVNYRDRDGSGHTLLQNLNRLLKLIALKTYPSANVASLSGMQWLCFLDDSRHGRQRYANDMNEHNKANQGLAKNATDASAEQAPFTQGAGALLASYPYQPATVALDPQQLTQTIEVCRRWIKKQ